MLVLVWRMCISFFSNLYCIVLKLIAVISLMTKVSCLTLSFFVGTESLITRYRTRDCFRHSRH